jgi:nifR3 family TIM-barrel protein
MKNLLPKNSNGCPYLLLAPMEGVGDKSFRKAISSIGGFDEAVTEFISVPSNAHVESLAKVYDREELSPIPIAAQIMGSDPTLMALMARQLEKKGAPRIDINCGCPSNTVTGRGAGSSLLKDPNSLYTMAKTVVTSVSTPVTLKMRSGYEDISLFKENLLAAEESGVQFITLHPRTKVEGYKPPARWDLIALAKQTLHIPVIGNGDVTSLEKALLLLKETECDAIMIGRGAIINPFLFHQIKGHFNQSPYQGTPQALIDYLDIFLKESATRIQPKGLLGKLKQLMSFLFQSNPQLLEKRQEMLKSQLTNAEDFKKEHLQTLLEDFFR